MNKTASAANFAALALLAVVLAYWSWVWLAPAAAASSAVRLLGVVAASGDRLGHAVLRLDAKSTVAVLQGEDVEPGLRLVEVHPDHIVLERNGARESVAWPEKSRK